MLDLVLLRTFVSVVDTGNFTRAGEHLHLTQSTVSQQVIRLEQNLGCRLLDRSQRQVLPTEEGERLLGYARRLLRLSDEASEALSPAHGDGVLRLGVPEDLAGEVLMPVLTRFTEERPRLRLRSRAVSAITCCASIAAASWTCCWSSSGGRQRLPCTLGRAAGLVRQRRAAVRRGFAGGAGAAGGVPGRRAVSPGDDPCPESIGRRWRIGYSSASLASLVAAVGAGLGSACCRWAASGPSIACLARRPASRPSLAWSWRSTRGPSWTAPGAPSATACATSAMHAWKGCRASAERCLRAMIRLPQRMDTEARHMSRPTPASRPAGRVLQLQGLVRPPHPRCHRPDRRRGVPGLAGLRLATAQSHGDRRGTVQGAPAGRAGAPPTDQQRGGAWLRRPASPAGGFGRLVRRLCRRAAAGASRRMAALPLRRWPRRRHDAPGDPLPYRQPWHLPSRRHRSCPRPGGRAPAGGYLHPVYPLRAAGAAE